MKIKKIVLAITLLASPLYAENNQQLVNEINQLQQQTQKLQAQINKLQRKMISQRATQVAHKEKSAAEKADRVARSTLKNNKKTHKKYHSTQVSVHALDRSRESIGFYPTALVAENKVITYIAGTPVVSSPYLGSRPAFDGSDYIVNISSINRDIRLMQQRRSLYQAYNSIGYTGPEVPIIALSGKVEPNGALNNPFRSNSNGDLTLGSNEVDVAAILNHEVEAYVAIAYDASPPDVGPRTDNSAFALNLGFINIGNLDKTPWYFTAGQLYVPFGRYSSSMISAPLTLNLARTKTRPFILGYKSQELTGPFAAAYIYKSDTILGKSGVGGGNLGYIYNFNNFSGEVGASYIGSIADSGGMQYTDVTVGTTFGGFGSLTNGNEAVRKTQAAGVHGNIAFDSFNLAAEWVGVTQAFRPQDLSFNGRGARPQAGQVEFGVTFRSFNRPSSIGLGYQWTKNALALNLPQQRIIGVFNISIWKDTVESLEYRHDIDYNIYQFANGAAPAGTVNGTTFGTGRTADTLSAQIGVYF